MKNDLLQQALYTGGDIPDVIAKYANALKANPSIANVNHANRLIEYKNSITNKNLLYRLRKNFNGIYTLLDKHFRDVRFVIDGRRKSLISFERKVEKLIAEGKELDQIKDTFAFRVIVFGTNSYSLINTCYNIANCIIEYSINNGLTCCETSLSDIGTFVSKDYPNVIIPKKTGIKKDYRLYVKDYFLNPKENGYQSLHLLFKATTGEYFEVQIRTFDMHVHAESGDANHAKYKNKKYQTSLDFEPQKVKIPGYGISPNGKIYDFIGLEKGLEILKRQKTY